jgi:hypothetical protein
MKLTALLKPLSSVRAQMVAFIALMLAITMLVIFVVNQNQEQKTTKVVDDYIRAIPQAIDIVNRSLSEGLSLYNIVNQDSPDSLTVDSESIIRHIFVVEANGNIFDSTDRDDVNQQFKSVYQELPTFQMGDLSEDEDGLGRDESRTIKFSTRTDYGKRDTFIVISMSRLKRVKEAGERIRLGIFAGLGLLLIVVIAIFSKRFTRPITELGRAARKVTEGELDFNVPVSGPEEVNRLSNTFNEMLSGLRSKRDLEEQLQRAERSAMVGRLASGIAHEIRNPLNFINLSIDHLREAFAPKEESLRGPYTHILVTIKDELARLNRLVSDFLSYGRPAKLKIREIDARSLIEEVRDLVRTQAEQQGVKVNIEQNGTGDARLRADAEQIKTCFSNLMINAIQAMPGGGSLSVSLQPNSSRIHIEFADTGVGIDPEAMEQIFEPYYSTKETGIGLGLPLTRKIIEEHGGRISVVSETGRGTTFTVTLLREPKIMP